MAGERRSEIYVSYRVKNRLHNVLKVYPQLVEQEIRGEFGDRIIGERLMTVEELAERILTEHIEKHFPIVLEMEARIRLIEKEMIEKGKGKTK